jgi:hypothetical protein
MFIKIKTLYFLLIKYFSVCMCELFAGVQIITEITNEAKKYKWTNL